MDFPKSVPSVGLVDGKFVDEDVVAGTPGSLIPAQWGNAVTEELLNVIESAGLTPDEDNNAQLLAAVNSKIAAAIPSAPPDASTTVKGLVELATDAETQAGVDALRAVTPAALTARTASETRAGIIELATAAETQSGIDAVRAVTPATLASRTATDTRAGIVELATDAETQAGVDTARAITPASLASRTATESRLGIVQLATSAEAVAGADSSKAISVLRVWQAITSRFATQGQVDTGTDDSTMVTPKKIKNGVAYVLGSSGYVSLPSWLGGFTVQWGRVSGAAGSIVQPFPTTFSNSCYGVVGTPILGGLNRVESLNVSAVSITNFTSWRSYTASGTAAGSNTEYFYFAWGV
ncbi:gp53-like domain-containing protein [Pseudomonas corrugata]